MKYLNLKKALAAWQDIQPLSEKGRERLSRRFTVDFNYNSIITRYGDRFEKTVAGEYFLHNKNQTSLWVVYSRLPRCFGL